MTNPQPPCKHTTPQPNDCKWCFMGLRKDRRYGRLWWPELFRTYEQQSTKRRH